MKDYSDLKLIYEHIIALLLEENQEKNARKNLFVANQRVADATNELQKQLKQNNAEMIKLGGKAPTDEFSKKRLRKVGEVTKNKALVAFNATKDAEDAQNIFNQVSDKRSKGGIVIPFKHESLLNVFESLEELITEMINTSISGMMTPPNDVVGREPIMKQRKGSQKNNDKRFTRRIKIRKASMK